MDVTCHNLETIRQEKIRRRRPTKRWRDDLDKCGSNTIWQRTAHDRLTWRRHAEAFAHPWDTTATQRCGAWWPSRLALWTGTRVVLDSNPATATYSLRNFGTSVYPALPVCFGRDTKSRRALLSGVYATGSKRSHTVGKCATCRVLHVLT